MGLANSQLWGSLVPNGDLAAGGGIDTEEVIDRVLPALRATARADLTFWTAADLIGWMDDALKRLARVACVFVERDSTLQTAPAQARYSLPPRHIATLHASYGALALRPTTQLELEAGDEEFLSSTGTPAEWYEDQLGQTEIGVYPAPEDTDALPIIFAAWPPTLDAAGQDSLVAAPAPLKFYLAMMAIAGAYGREGDMEMPEVSQHCRENAAMLETVFVHYWGPPT